MSGASRSLCITIILCSAGCGRYADFSLPVLHGPSAPASLTWRPAAAPALTPGDWDSSDVLNPSVIHHGGEYYNFYSGFDGKTWHTGVATSPDGERWSKQGRILSPLPDTWEGTYIAANGSALFDRGEFVYWYVSGPRDRHAIGLAQSSDAKTWRKNPGPVLEPGPRGSWDERGVADPAVLRIDDTLYMYYLGQDRARRQRLGVARSSDGVHWRKLRANPVMEGGADGSFDERLGEPAVWTFRGRYWMLYTGRDIHEIRRLGLARSADGVTWEKLPGAIAGTEPWNSKVLCDASVLVEGDAMRVWFGGGDVASPDENLHGRIGTAKLVP